jgi:hypothetical protein
MWNATCAFLTLGLAERAPTSQSLPVQLRSPKAAIRSGAVEMSYVVESGHYLAARFAVRRQLRAISHNISGMIQFTPAQSRRQESLGSADGEWIRIVVRGGRGDRSLAYRCRSGLPADRIGSSIARWCRLNDPGNHQLWLTR